MLQRVCVFCGSSSGIHAVYLQAAEQLGRLLAKRGIGLVYGGGKVGLMGALADACLTHGGQVVGVMPKMLVEKEIAHGGLTKLHVVESMHERKAVMADLADAFIALPGGYGTWDEFCEVLTWSQLGLHRKACALVNVNRYYDPLLVMADRAQDEGFLRDVHRELLLADTDVASLLDRLTGYVVPVVDKWIDKSTR
ncbi:MAG: TIGR00730 family Rossman fold protein [Acidobacteriaceae bacterium]|nr:TIGR00730 family Rossman fold protein [Acidobacteriaceae bacterium]